MTIRSNHYISISQSVLFICLLVCLLLVPDYFFSLNQGGISNYGTDNRTSLFFSIGFAAAALGSVIAGSLLPATLHRRKSWQLGLFILGFLYLLVLLTTYPYKQNASYESLHLSAAFLLAIAMLIGVVCIRFGASNDRLIKQAFVLYLVGFAVALLTLFGIVDMLFTVQVICGISFGYIVTRGLTIATHEIAAIHTGELNS